MKEKKSEKVAAQKVMVQKNIVTEKPQANTFQLLLPHLVALGIFALTTVLYFSPMLLDNKVINQNDIIQWKGMSKEVTDYHNATGENTLWTNSMFGGMPAFQISLMYEGNLLQYIDKILGLGFPHPSQLLLIAFVCYYVLLTVLRLNPWLAIGGALAFGLSSYNLILLEAGHTSKLHAIGLMPLTVAGIWLLREGKYSWGAVLTAMGLSLQILANHLQITFYLFLLIVIYAIVELIYAVREKNYRNLLFSGAIAVVCALFAVISNASLLWSTLDYTPSTIRGPSELTSNQQSAGGLDKDYAMTWSYGKLETLTLLIPNAYGGSSQARVGQQSNYGELLKQYNVPSGQMNNYLNNAPMYWGDPPFTSGPVYAGAFICFLFLFGMLVIRERWKWWLLSVSVLAIFLAWGKNLMWFSDLFFYYFPGYNKFRTVAMSLVILQVTFPFMGFMLLSKIIKGEYDKDYLISKLKLSVYILGGLCLLFAIAGSVFLSFKGINDQKIQKEIIDAVIADRKVLLRMDALRSLVIILTGAALIWALLKEKINRKLFIGATALLIFIDLFTVGKRYLNEDNFISKSDYNRNFEPTATDQLILKETSKNYRVFNLTRDPFTDSRTSYFHKSLGGYHAAKLRRYQEIIEHQLTKSDTTNPSGFPFNKSVVDMLNTKYIIYKTGEQEQVFPNTEALDNAWFGKNVQLVDNADAEMQALNSFDPAATVIIDKRFAPQIKGFSGSYDSSATIGLQSYAPNHLIYKSKSSHEELAVFSEIYYQPGWDAFIDGKKTEHFRCNYILRGMRVPAGEHTIEFKFEPASFYTGEKIAMAGSGIILLLLLGVAGMTLKNRRQLERLKDKDVTKVSGTSAVS
jgi:hypothetical protein